MSEYQYLRFIACDRPSDDEASGFVEQQATPAGVSCKNLKIRALGPK